MFENIIQKIKYLSFTSGLQQAFLEDVAAMIEDGVPASQVIEMQAELTTGLTAEVSRDIQNSIAQGKSIADGMQGWFSSSIVEIIRAGESSGTLLNSIQTVAKLSSQQNTVIASMISSLTYPLIVVSMGLGVTVYVKNSVFKQFVEVKSLATWPTQAQFVYRLGDWIEHHWLLLIVLLVIMVVGIASLLTNYIGKGRTFLDSLPIIGLYRDLVAARFMETLGIMVASGVVFKNALRILQYNANPYLAFHLLNMEYRLGTGKANIAEVLATGLIDEKELQRLRLIALGKGFEHALQRQGRRMGERSVNRLTRLWKVVGAMLLGIGALLAVLLIMSIYGVGMMLGTGG